MCTVVEVFHPSVNRLVHTAHIGPPGNLVLPSTAELLVAIRDV